jgi:hypothetical protein
MEHVTVTRNSVVIHEGFINNEIVKLALIDEIIAKRLPLQRVAIALLIKVRTMQSQVASRKSKRYLHVSPGRPSILDEIGEEALSAHLAALRGERMTATNNEFKDLVVKFMNGTLVRRNMLPAAKCPHYTTLVDLKKRLDIRVGKGQTTTPARQQAQRDIRNYVSVGVMHQAMCENIMPELIFNFDATTYGTNGANQWVVYPHDINDMSPATRVDNSGLNLFVKSFFYHNSEGDVAPLVLVVCDDTMIADTIDVHPCPGGSWHGSIGGPSSGAYRRHTQVWH